MANTNHRKAIIGSKKNFWLYSTSTGFDLTHPSEPSSPPIHPRLPLDTTTARVVVDPKKTALVVIDMQNFFLSPDLGRSETSNGLKASDALISKAIPASRRAGIQVIWLNWGLTQEDIDDMPPATLRAFGFQTAPIEVQDPHSGPNEAAIDDHGINQGAERIAKKAQSQAALGRDPRIYKGLGSEVGPVQLEDGSTRDGGKLLMRDQWNSALYSPLEAVRSPADVWIHKNRMSGLWGAQTDCTHYLEANGIRTLLFAGVNTDQCVGGSLQDAFTKGFDCLLVTDCCGTTSPDHSQQCIEFNTAKTWGFTLTADTLLAAANNMEM